MAPTRLKPLTSARRAATLVVALLAGLAGCEKEEPKEEKPQEVILNVRTVDLQNKPVEMVRFYINGKKFGITDQDGTFKGRYPAKDGDTLTFNVEAPQGYSVPPNVDQSRWQLKVKYPSDGRPLQVDFTATLQRPERDYLFMVQTQTPATPIKVNDKLVGKTGAGGNALLRVTGVPGTEFIARAEDVSLKGKFAEEDAVYLMTPTAQKVIGGEPMVAAVEPPEPEAPEPAAAEPEAEPEAAPDPAPAVAVAEPEPEPEPVRVAAAPSRQPEPRRYVPEPEPDPEPEYDEPEPEPAPAPAIAVIEPEPPPVAAAPPADDPLGDIMDDGGDDVLIGDAPAAAPAVVVAAAPAAPSGGGGLAEDDGEVVAPEAAQAKATVTGGGGPSVATMDRAQISARLDEVKSRLDRSNVLTKADVDFLSQIDRTHPGYYEANRLLADFYFELKDYKRQAEALEIATKRGRYKHDPMVLLSLAKSYAHMKNYRKALSTMGRVERKMRRLPAKHKADAYRVHGELLEFEFLRQQNDDPKRANVSLIDKAISKWERYQTFSRGANPGAVAKAEKKIQELNQLKGQVGL